MTPQTDKSWEERRAGGSSSLRAAHNAYIKPAKPIYVSHNSKIPCECYLCTWVATKGKWELKYVHKLCVLHAKIECVAQVAPASY